MTIDARRKKILYAAGALAVVAFVLLRRGHGGGGGGGGAADVPLAGAPAADAAISPGASSPDNYAAGYSDLISFADLTAGRLDQLETTQGTLVDSLGGIRDAISAFAGPGDFYGPAPGASPPTTDDGAGGQTPAASPGNRAATERARGFWWGSQWITSAAQMRDTLRATGANTNLHAWARSHPAAAQTIGLTVPAAPPPRTQASAPAPAQRATVTPASSPVIQTPAVGQAPPSGTVAQQRYSAGQLERRAL